MPFLPKALQQQSRGKVVSVSTEYVRIFIQKNFIFLRQAGQFLFRNKGKPRHFLQPQHLRAQQPFRRCIREADLFRQQRQEAAGQQFRDET